MAGAFNEVPFQLESEVRLKPPSLALLLNESRALTEWICGGRALRKAVPTLPRGDGHAVLVLPGFGMSDRATAPLRAALRALGYQVHGWDQGRNLGMRPALKMALREKLLRLVADSGGPVSLIGWSLGGVYARELARHQAQQVRQVITLGSPINGRPDANNLNTLFRWASGKPPTLDWEGFQRRRMPPPVPCTAIYTRSDGIVAWRCCLEEALPGIQNIEVRGTHMGLVVNPQVLRHLAACLARPISGPELAKN